VGYTPEEANSDIAAAKADAVFFGRRYISNPDLAFRIEQGKEIDSTSVEFKDLDTWYAYPDGHK
jgi:2,4-dienoyl-CoA reductase-like NADH-dependent reductase (Old Yellow Enzyme family)